MRRTQRAQKTEKADQKLKENFFYLAVKLQPSPFVSLFSECVNRIELYCSSFWQKEVRSWIVIQMRLGNRVSEDSEGLFTSQQRKFRCKKIKILAQLRTLTKRTNIKTLDFHFTLKICSSFSPRLSNSARKTKPNQLESKSDGNWCENSWVKNLPLRNFSPRSRFSLRIPMSSGNQQFAWRYLLAHSGASSPRRIFSPATNTSKRSPSIVSGKHSRSCRCVYIRPHPPHRVKGKGFVCRAHHTKLHKVVPK